MFVYVYFLSFYGVLPPFFFSFPRPLLFLSYPIYVSSMYMYKLCSKCKTNLLLPFFVAFLRRV